MPTPTKPLRKDAARSRQKILDTAADLLKERGLNFTLNELAKEAGVGVGTVYRHFDNLDQLQLSLLEAPLAELEEKVTAYTHTDNPLHTLRTGLLEICDFLIHNRALIQVLFTQPEEDIRSRAPFILTVFTPLIDEAKKQGGVRQDFAATDLPFIFSYAGSISPASTPEHPELWRRYIVALIDGLLGTPHRQVPSPLTEDEFNQLPPNLYR